MDRGEIPAGTDAREVIRAVSAPLYYRLLVSVEELDESSADLSAEVAATAARAGVFVRHAARWSNAADLPPRDGRASTTPGTHTLH